ncbi:MAG TPA: TonB-dependent receptor [Acidobacteriota bacterium]|nr:TonB-dependent receptor [Acidobacteriota bacterium]
MPERGRNLPKWFAIASLVLVLCATGLMAQAVGTVTGSVVDATQAVIPGVEVTITNRETSSSQTTLTSDRGVYRVGNLLPGSYEVKAALTGFKTALSQITVTVGDVVRVDLTLEVGEVNEVITVTDAGTAINVEQGRVSELVSRKQIEDLPLNGRNVFSLMQTAPGAVNTESTIDEPGQNTNVNGGRANMNGFWMDGISITALSGGTGAGDGPGMNPNLEMIQEFRIETLNFSAEYGANVGSVVSVVTKSGSNAFHGSVYNFLRNDNLDAREFFDEEKPEFKQNQFGVSFGGPIAKDKTFFFGTYEGLRVRTGESQLATFESSAWANYAQQYASPVGQYLWQNYPAPTITTATSTVGEYLDEFGWADGTSQAAVDQALGENFGSPAGALSADAAMIGETSFFSPDSTNTNGGSIRVDHEFGQNDRMYGRFYYNKLNGVQVPDPRPAFSSPVESGNTLIAVSWTHVFSPIMVNEARTGFTRNVTDILAGDPGVPFIYDAGSGVGVASTFGSYNGYPQFFHENIYTWADTMSLNMGDHGFKIGGEVRRNQENSEFNVARPSTYFYDLVYIALDDPYYQVAGVNPDLENGTDNYLESSERGWRGTTVGLFFNDDWKVAPNLTVNLGVRWDWFSRLTEVHGRATQYSMTQGSDFLSRVRLGEFMAADQLSPNDWNNFAPRFGFAWDPFSDGKMSIRGGFGIAYQSGIFNPLANSRWNKPYYSFNLVCDTCGRENADILYGPQDGSPVRIDGANNNPGAQLMEGNIIAYEPTNANDAFLSGIPDPSIRDPYSMSYFVGVQREIVRDAVIEVNYVGNLGRKLIRAENPNRFPGDRLGWPSPFEGEFAGDDRFNRLNPDEGTLRFFQNAVNSNYHSLQANFTKRYGNGVAINANYTWSKVTDTRSTWHSGATSSNQAQEGYSTDWFQVGQDYGRAIFDARQRFVFSGVWDMPFLRDADNAVVRSVFGGWQLNAIYSAQTGQPFTPYIGLSFPRGGDFNADGNNNDRPNTPAVGNYIQTDRHDYVNPDNGIFNFPGNTTEERLEYFGTPEPGTLGNLGRNTYDGPGFANFDFSLFKDFMIPQISEDSRLQLRFEFFNILNRANFWQPEPKIENRLFGRSSQTFDAREIQIGIKFLF